MYIFKMLFIKKQNKICLIRQDTFHYFAMSGDENKETISGVLEKILYLNDETY